MTESLLLRHESKVRNYATISWYVLLMALIICGMVLIHDGLTDGLTEENVGSILQFFLHIFKT